ncbi:MAG: Gfo/Idh/MocA family protein [Candidatus Merdivicinus sp.]
MENRTYGVVLIGCGHIGESHIEEIYYRDGIRIVATVDFHAEAAQLFARKYGAEAWGTDYRPFIKRADVDIVIIATYADSHLPILRDCLKEGKHVICEKPMTEANEQDAEEFYRLASQSSSKVLIAHILRHNETYQRVRQMIQDGMIGEVRLMRMVQNHHIMNAERYGRLMEDCPPFVDCGVHYIDVARWFSGREIVSVGGIGSRVCDLVPEGKFDHGILTMKLDNGATVIYEAGWAETIAAENTKEFIGNKGRIRITLQSDRHADREEGDLIEYYNAETKEYRTINSPSIYKNMWAQMQCLIDMIDGKSEGSPTLEDAYRAFRIVLLGWRAIQQGTMLQVPSKF